MYVIRQAVNPDRSKIKKLLLEVGLQQQCIDDHYKHFFVVEEVDEHDTNAFIIGTVGIEVYGSNGLLRTFILERNSWNAKLGLQMIQVMLSYVNDLKLTHVYLLTRSAVPFFEQLGFSIISLSHIPEEIKESNHVIKMKDKGVSMVYVCNPKQIH